MEDLKAEDFELLENGVKQQVQAFERVVISPAGPQSMRVEANSVRGGEQMAASAGIRRVRDLPHPPRPRRLGLTASPSRLFRRSSIASSARTISSRKAI